MDGITVGWLAERNAHKFPEKEAVVQQGPDGREAAVTHAEFDARTNRVARGLQARGLSQGDTVAVYMQNNVETLETYLGAMKAGVLPVPINHRFTADEVAYVLADSDAALLVFDDDAREVVDDLQGREGTPDDALHVGATTPAYAEDYATWREANDGDHFDIVPGQLDDATLMYTSGTTGRPKGCILTHDNLVMQATNAAIERGIDDQAVAVDGRSLVVTPLFHIAAFGLFLNAFYVSATTVLLADFVPERVLSVLEAESVTEVFFVPMMARALLNVPDFGAYDLSALDDVAIGAAPSGRELKATIRERFDADLSEAFGQTEMSPTTTMLHPSEVMAKPDAVGRPLLNVMTKVVDPETGEPVGPGEIGRICYKGPTRMRGYYGMPERTDEVIDERGWFHSGDLVRQDEDGFLEFVGRTDDMIITGGENVYPAEIEEVLHEHEAVDEVAVVGAPDETYGERIKAAIVLHEGADLTAEDVQSYVGGRLAGFKKPREVVFLDSLPRNPTGKVLKGEVETVDGTVLPPERE
ncbi:class I adenylate-forming enzyme family protein [Haloglomus litoreum]|uniref:class I adenylate-forming enzyme family protein n=1 Tax=Haloglomus litoreum TaxID=3034026 RepID=UPI0023E86AAA|nr:AMP-binding protein [Haloglomus sp. DT116]